MTTEGYLIFYNYTYSLISTNNNKLVKSLQKIIFSGYYFLANCMTWDKKKTLRFNANPMTRFEDYAAQRYSGLADKAEGLQQIRRYIAKLVDF